MNKYKALAVILSLLLAVGLVEAVAKCLQWRKLRALDNQFEFLSSKAFGSLARSGASGWMHRDEFVTKLNANSAGFRTHEDMSVADIVVLGDSYVWGTGVEEEDRFSNLIEKATSLRVLNLGLCTAGTLNEWFIWDHFGRGAKPRVVVLFFYPNDVQNNLWWLSDIDRARLHERSYLREVLMSALPSISRPERESAAAELRTSYLVSLLRNALPATAEPAQSTIQVGESSYTLDTAIASGNSNWSPAIEALSKENSFGWSVVDACLRLWKKDSEQGQFRILAVYLPYQEAIYSEHWQQRKNIYGLRIPDELVDFDLPRKRFSEICKAHGIPLLDLTESLRRNARVESPDLYYLKDGHLTPRGNMVVANILKQALKEMGIHRSNTALKD